MARVISDTGIPDKSVGDRADRGYASHAQIHRICARQSACRAPIFPSLPSSPLHANLPVIIASRRLTRPVEIGIAFEDRTARIINGIGSNRFRYTITVTVTVMEKEGAITTAEIATALFLPSSRRNIGLIFCAT